MAWPLTGSRASTAEEGFKDITEATEIESLTAPTEEIIGATVTEAIIGGSLIYIRKHLIGFIDLFKPGLGTVIAITGVSMLILL